MCRRMGRRARPRPLAGRCGEGREQGTVWAGGRRAVLREPHRRRPCRPHHRRWVRGGKREEGVGAADAEAGEEASAVG
jgi:hypothetical protein